YGLMYLVGFVLFVILGRKRARQNLLTGWHPRDIDDMLFYGVLGVILGGRLGYVLFYKPLYYLLHPLEIFQVWQGGMSFHGGFLGVLIGLWFYARKRGRRWLDVTDFVAPLCPLGLAAGRLGNFINGGLGGPVIQHSRRGAKARVLPLWGQRSGRIGHPGRKRGGRNLVGTPELAVDHFVAIEGRPARPGGLRSKASMIDRQQEQQHRHRVGKDSRNDEENARPHL